MSFYIVTYYLPSGLFVVVSWISFLVNPEVIVQKEIYRSKRAPQKIGGNCAELYINLNGLLKKSEVIVQSYISI